MEYQYRGHQGLHSLWTDLEGIITELERRRRCGHGATKEIIKDLRELNDNLFTLQQEWYRFEQSMRPEGKLDDVKLNDLLKKLNPD